MISNSITNEYLEWLARLNPKTTDCRQDVGRGGKPEITAQEMAGAMAGSSKTYSELVINITHMTPTRSEARENMVLDCMRLIRTYEKHKGSLYKSTKPLSDDEAISLSNMALDWIIAGFKDKTEKFAADRLELYATKSIPVSTWVKKYEPIFVILLNQVAQKVQDVCNHSKDRIYDK